MISFQINEMWLFRECEWSIKRLKMRTMEYTEWILNKRAVEQGSEETNQQYSWEGQLRPLNGRCIEASQKLLFYQMCSDRHRCEEFYHRLKSRQGTPTLQQLIPEPKPVYKNKIHQLHYILYIHLSYQIYFLNIVEVMYKIFGSGSNNNYFTPILSTFSTYVAFTSILLAF